MPETIFPDHLIFVAPGQRVPAPASTGPVQEVAYDANGLWSGTYELAAGAAPGGALCYADQDSVLYLLAGRCRVVWGRDGAQHRVMAGGDFALVGQGVAHSLQALDGPCSCVVFRLGEGGGPGARQSLATRTALPGEVKFITPAERVIGPNTPGQNREKAFAEDGLWVGYCDITARNEPGAWHHHADYDSVMYLLSGRCRIDSGTDGRTETEMKAGDFGFFGKGVIHRVQILDDGKCDYVFIRFGQGESVFVVDGPGARIHTPAAAVPA